MKKTVVFDFPDDFEFPPEFIGEVCCLPKGSKPVVFCPFYAPDEYRPYCMLTGGEEGDGKACPFYHGASTVNYNDC